MKPLLLMFDTDEDRALYAQSLGGSPDMPLHVRLERAPSTRWRCWVAQNVCDHSLRGVITDGARSLVVQRASPVLVSRAMAGALLPERVFLTLVDLQRAAAASYMARKRGGRLVADQMALEDYHE